MSTSDAAMCWPPGCDPAGHATALAHRVPLDTHAGDRTMIMWMVDVEPGCPPRYTAAPGSQIVSAAS